MTSTAYRNNFASIFGTAGLTDNADIQPEVVEASQPETVVEVPAAPEWFAAGKIESAPAAQKAAPAAEKPASKPAAVPSAIELAAGLQSAAAELSEVEQLALQLEDAKEQAKRLYEEADRLMIEIHDAVGLGNSIRLSDGRKLEVVDNFRDSKGNPRIVAFRPCGVKLYDVKIK